VIRRNTALGQRAILDTVRTMCGIAVRKVGVMLAAGTLTLTGCGLMQPETAVNTSPSAVAPPTSSAPPPLPPRPFEMPLDHTDPCQVLTPDQRGQLGFDRGPTPDSEPGFGHAATCSFRDSQAKVATRLALITNTGMDVWTGDTAQVDATPRVLDGFPALVVKTPKLDTACNVEVDVADGQQLDVLYRDDGAKPPGPLDQLCAGAQRVAEESVTSLIHRVSSSSQIPSSSEPTG
jgi:hypothetical protein